MVADEAVAEALAVLRPPGLPHETGHVGDHGLQPLALALELRGALQHSQLELLVEGTQGPALRPQQLRHLVEGVGDRAQLGRPGDLDPGFRVAAPEPSGGARQLGEGTDDRPARPARAGDHQDQLYERPSDHGEQGRETCPLLALLALPEHLALGGLEPVERPRDGAHQDTGTVPPGTRPVGLLGGSP